MEAINTLIEQIPLSRMQLGYIMIGLGGLIVILVIISFIIGRVRRGRVVNYSANHVDRKLAKSGAGRATAGIAGAINSLPNSRPQGNFPPQSSSPNYVQPSQVKGSGGLSSMKADTEFVPKTENSEPETKDTGVPVGMENYTVPNQPANQPSNNSLNQTAKPTSSMNMNQNPNPVMNNNPTPTTSPSFGVNSAIPETKKPEEEKEVNFQAGANPSSMNASTSMSEESASAAPRDSRPEPIPEKVLSSPPVDPAILDYVRQTRALGHSDSAIRNELVKAGWNPIDIDRALSQR